MQRTMLELINQLDGFDPRGNIKVLMATNRPDTLDPALMRPGRLDRKIEFSLPDLEVSVTYNSDKKKKCYFFRHDCHIVSQPDRFVFLGTYSHLQDSCPLYECGERYPL